MIWYRRLAAYAAIVEVFALEQVPILLLQATSPQSCRDFSSFGRRILSHAGNTFARPEVREEEGQVERALLACES